MSLAVTPAAVVPSMSATGRRAARSTLLQGKVPAKPFTHGTLVRAVSGSSFGWPFPPGLWCSPSCASEDQTARLRAKRSARGTTILLMFMFLTDYRRERSGRGEVHIITKSGRAGPAALAEFLLRPEVAEQLDAGGGLASVGVGRR